MNSDVKILQNIADTLKEEPLASQRVLAEKAEEIFKISSKV